MLERSGRGSPSLDNPLSALPTHLKFTDFSESTQTQTHYIIELFSVELSSGAHHRVEANSENRWLTDAEIQAGETRVGRPVSATMKRLLEAMESAKIG